MILNHFGNQLDENKIAFIKEIQQLAYKLDLKQFLVPEGFFQLCGKSIEELFLLKYELLVISMDLMQLLVNFRDIGNYSF